MNSWTVIVVERGRVFTIEASDTYRGGVRRLEAYRASKPAEDATYRIVKSKDLL